MRVTLSIDDSDVCDLDPSKVILPDATLSLHGGIWVGPLSVKEPLFGSAVIAHEIAHNLSLLIKNTKLSQQSKQKQKITMGYLYRLHPERLKNPIYQEEDWADLFSTLTLSESDPNMWCMMYKKSDESISLSELPSTIQSGFSFFGEDPHSSGFFRLLHTQSIKNGRIPHSCNQYLNLTDQPRKFPTCIKPSVLFR